MTERFLHIIQMKNMTAAQFADALGIQRSAISHFSSGRNRPSLELVMKVLTVFPDINMEWLMFGKGEPIRTADLQTGKRESQEPLLQESTIRFPEEDELTNTKRNEPFPVSNKTQKKSPGQTFQPECAVPDKIIFFNSDGTFRIYRPE